MAKVKVGVAGVGVMGEHHVRIYSALKEASLIGLFDSSPDRAREISTKYQCQSFSSLDSLLSQVSALTLASPTSTHFDLATHCLNHKKHLLVEKPLAPTLSEAQELVNLAKAKKCILACGMIERFNPAFTKALSLVRHEKLLGLDFKRFSPFPERISDASVVMDMMLHDLDLALALAPAKLTSFKAHGNKLRSSRLDEASATLFFSDGLIAKIDASRVKESKQRTLAITTDKCLYEADLLNKRLFKRDFESLSIRQELEVKSEDQLTIELKDFLRAVAQGRLPRVPGSESISLIKLAEEVEKQACS
jgi:predicted dehydrogenase